MVDAVHQKVGEHNKKVHEHAQAGWKKTRSSFIIAKQFNAIGKMAQQNNDEDAATSSLLEQQDIFRRPFGD